MRRINLSPVEDFPFPRYRSSRPRHAFFAALLATLLFVVPAFVAARGQSAGGSGSIHGHVQDTVGLPMTDGIVTLSTDGGKTAKYTFKTDSNGDYKGSGIEVATYAVSLRQPTTPADKVVDQFLEVKITPGGDTLQDFDLTRPEYVSKLTPEQRKEAEEVRAKNAQALKENSVIKNLNANLAKAREDNAKGRKGPCISSSGAALPGHAEAASCSAAGGTPNNFQEECTEAETLMSQATQAKPDASILWLELGSAQYCLQKYDAAVTSLEKAISVDAASKKPSPEIQGGAGSTLGEVLAKQKKVAESQAAYDAAAKANPTSAASYYQNEAIVMYYTVQNLDAAAAAADKAIAADPTKPNPYYFKGQALISKASVDPKTNKIVAPQGCAEAYQKYLELAPDGPFANDVRGVLEGMGQTIKSTYKAKK